MPDFQPPAADPANVAYLATVDALWPGLDDWQRMQRAQIMALRDAAAVGIQRCQGDAGNLLFEVQRLGTLYALAPLSHANLMRLVLALDGMMASARFLEKATR